VPGAGGALKGDVNGLLGSGTLTQAPFEVSAIVRKGTLDVGGDLGVRASLKISAIASAELGATELDSILAQNASRATARAQVLMDTGSTTRHLVGGVLLVSATDTSTGKASATLRDSAILWSTGMLGGRNEWRHRADASLDNLNVTAGGGVQVLAQTAQDLSATLNGNIKGSVFYSGAYTVAIDDVGGGTTAGSMRAR
jgi:hypothetical protein